MDKKYTVFVSSTYRDLIGHRKKVIESILKASHIPLGMEAFAAASASQWEIIKQTIDQSDYYVLIIQHRYGTVDPTSGIGYTEMEFDYAVQTNVPVLAFLPSESVAVTPDKMETDPKLIKKLNAFKEKAKTSRVVDFYNNDDDLTLRVNSALFGEFQRTPRPGWIRGEGAMSEEVTLALARLTEENASLRAQLKDQDKFVSPQSKAIAFRIGDNKLKVVGQVGGEEREIVVGAMDIFACISDFTQSGQRSVSSVDTRVINTFLSKDGVSLFTLSRFIDGKSGPDFLSYFESLGLIASYPYISLTPLGTDLWLSLTQQQYQYPFLE